MAGKDISDMSFDEFFLGKKQRKQDPPKPAQRPDEDPKPKVDDSGFGRARPKINVRGSEVLLFIPKYKGPKGSRYAVSVVQDGKTVQLGNLRLAMLDSDPMTIPAEFDLLGAGVSPLDAFMVCIDGKEVYEMFSHQHLLFSAEGMPISRAEDTTVVLHRKGTYLWLTDAEVATTAEAGGLLIDTVEVAPGGFVKVRDRAPPAEKQETPEPKAVAAKVKPSASISLPPAEAVVSVKVGGKTLPLYASFPTPVLSAKGDGEFSVRIGDEAVPLPEFDLRDVASRTGQLRIDIIADGRSLASKEFFVAPGFSYSYDGKGDIPEDGTVTFSVDGEERVFDIYDGPEFPCTLCGTDAVLVWNIPSVTFDVGKGETRFREVDVDVDDIPDSIVVTVRGTGKRAVFLGGAGKKVLLTPDWIGDTVRIDAKPVKEAVFSSPTRDASLYITVNSCPVKKFATIRNAVGMEASYSDGKLRVTVRGSCDHVCRVFNIDKTVEETMLSEGEHEVPVGPGAVSAEVAEIRSGREIAVESVTIKELPFLMRDAMGDVWLHVSKDKRIPLPDGLLEKSSDPAEVRRWHALIVRMNPELKGVSPDKTVQAFKEFASQ